MEVAPGLGGGLNEGASGFRPDPLVLVVAASALGCVWGASSLSSGVSGDFCSLEHDAALTT